MNSRISDTPTKTALLSAARAYPCTAFWMRTEIRVFPFVYDDIYAADSVNLSEKPLWKVQQGKNWLLLDADGKEIFRHPCSGLQYNAKLGLCSVITENGAGILKISYSKPVSYRRIVTVSTDTTNIRLTLGDTAAFVNAEAKTLIPRRFCATTAHLCRYVFLRNRSVRRSSGRAKRGQLYLSKTARRFA